MIGAPFLQEIPSELRFEVETPFRMEEPGCSRGITWSSVADTEILPRLHPSSVMMGL